MQLRTYMHGGIYTGVRDTCTGCGGESYTEVRDKYMHGIYKEVRGSRTLYTCI